MEGSNWSVKSFIYPLYSSKQRSIWFIHRSENRSINLICGYSKSLNFLLWKRALAIEPRLINGSIGFFLIEPLESHAEYSRINVSNSKPTKNKNTIKKKKKEEEESIKFSKNFKRKIVQIRRILFPNQRTKGVPFIETTSSIYCSIVKN